MTRYLIVPLVVSMSLAAPRPSQARDQGNPWVEYLTGVYADVVRDIIRVWLVDPSHSELETLAWEFLEKEAELSETSVKLYGDTIDMNRGLPFQLFESYLRERGVGITPRDFLMGGEFVVDVKE